MSQFSAHCPAHFHSVIDSASFSLISLVLHVTFSLFINDDACNFCSFLFLYPWLYPSRYFVYLRACSIPTLFGSSWFSFLYQSIIYYLSISFQYPHQYWWLYIHQRIIYLSSKFSYIRHGYVPLGICQVPGTSSLGFDYVTQLLSSCLLLTTVTLLDPYTFVHLFRYPKMGIAELACLRLKDFVMTK